MTTPQVVVSIEVTRDEYLASYVSDQVWQISGGEVVVAWDVDGKDSDRCHLDCYGLEVRVDSKHLVVESLLDVDQDSSTWQLIWIPPQRIALAIIVGTSVVTQGWRVLQFCFLQAYVYIEVETKWSPFHTRNFQTHIIEWKYYNVDHNFTDVCLKVLVNNIPSLVQMLAWRHSGHKPLSETMVASLLTHIVTQPKWIDNNAQSTTVIFCKLSQV